MDQSRISDFFSSSPSSHISKHRATSLQPADAEAEYKKNLFRENYELAKIRRREEKALEEAQCKERIQKTTKKLNAVSAKRDRNLSSTEPAIGGTQSNSFTQSKQQPQQAMPTSTRKPNRQKPKTSSSQTARAATVLPSIPSTPISETMASSQAAKKTTPKGRNERILETPQQNRSAMSTRDQRTPARTTQLAQANSPHTPFDISSGEESDSDCMIEKVLPSPNPKRKLVPTSKSTRPTKKAKTEEPSSTQNRYASVKASVLRGSAALSRQKTKPVSRQRQAASVPPRAPLPNLALSTESPGHSNSVPPTKENQQAQQTSVSQNEEESDCYIEKVEPSPKKRQQIEEPKADVKRRRVGDSVDTPVSIDADEADEQSDSDFEVIKVLVSPKRRQAASKRVSNKNSQSTQRKKLTPRKPQSPYARKQPTPAPSVAARERTPSPAVHIDLTQESDGSSDLSDEETTPTSAQPAPLTPVQHVSDAQNLQVSVAKHVANDNTNNSRTPRESIATEEQSQPPLPDIMSALWDWTDNPQKQKPLRTCGRNSASPDDDLPFSTAPEYPYNDSAARKIKLESHDKDMRFIKRESNSRYDPSDEEDSDSENLKHIKLEGGSSARKLFAVKQYDSDDDSEEEWKGFPDFPHDEILQDAEVNVFEDQDTENTEIVLGSRAISAHTARDIKSESVTSAPIRYHSESDEYENARSSPSPYQLPLKEIPPKRKPYALGDEPDDKSTASDLGNVPGITKTQRARSVSNFEKRLSSSIYQLQPVYSGEKLEESHTPGTPSSFRPHHRDSLVGLKGILKGPGTPGHESENETVYSPFPAVSPLSGNEHAVSSPTERIQYSKEQAKVIRPTERRVS
ncbi:hypothetical protein F53441_965 [Fusarium austroafricanum]|uniref:Uncharacterized protein n=1 Tax=Fusarium austroafricanum TaxID=2364996 RepID=A0A8H4P2T3_9HYPO|nr:hypothetical protein F53441_965 [Fusarium austroafricanum]